MMWRRRTQRLRHGGGGQAPRSTVRMLYQAYQAYADLALPVRGMAALTALMMRAQFPGPLAPPWWGSVASAWDMAARTALTHERPAFGISRVAVGGREVAVREEI